MKCRAWALVLALALSACGDEPDGTAPREDAAQRPDVAATEVAGPERRILAFGDSLFAGYGLEEGQGYPDRLQAALRRQGINAQVIDSGVSGDTSAAGLQRIEFVLDGLGAPPDLAIVELGGNDLLRGISPLETRHNLDAILTELRERRIPVLLMGMRAPPNLGEAYVAEFDGIYPELAARPSIVALAKLDLPDVRERLPELREAFGRRDIALHAISAATSEGVSALLDAIERLLAEHPVPSRPRTAPLPR